MKRFLTPAFVLLFAFPSALSAQTRTVTLRQGSTVVQVTPTVAH